MNVADGLSAAHGVSMPKPQAKLTRRNQQPAEHIFENSRWFDILRILVFISC